MVKQIIKICDRELFWAHYLENRPGGGFFVETEQLFNLGEEIELLLDFEGLTGYVSFHGTVAWHRRRKPILPRGPIGIGIDFNAACLSTKNFVLSYCAGRKSESRVAGPRVECDFPVRFFWNESWRYGRAGNLSRGGLCVVADQAVPEGEEVDLHVRVGSSGLPLASRVRVTRSIASQSGVELGLSFMSLSAGMLSHIDGVLSFVKV